ncbi:HRDC-like protein [Globomyces pollinis-pini]|nr:HRDC-like protein [Globomyces pollinis-pini]
MMPSHRKRVAAEDEDANIASFGPEFQDVRCLLISEVKVLLDVYRGRKNEIPGGDDTVTETMQKTMDYCAKFSKFNNKQTVQQIRMLFPSEEFHEFEMAQLANLTCESAEEALTLIPSLARVKEDDLQTKLTELVHLREFQ